MNHLKLLKKACSVTRTMSLDTVQVSFELLWTCTCWQNLKQWNDIHGRYPKDIHLFKVDNGNSRALCEICSKLKKRHLNDVNDVVLVSLLLTLNRLLHFTPLFWCFHCWLWRSKCRLGIILKPLLLLWTGTFPAPKHFQYLYGTWRTMKNSFRVTKKTQIDPFQPNIVFHRGNKSWEFQCKFQRMVSIWNTVLGWSGVL